MRAVRDDESGQALVIAAVAAFVLAGALAFTIDWGYALFQRQIAQNKADKIALGVGRLIATSVRSASTSGATFGVTKQDVCDEGLVVRDRDGITTSQAVERDSLVLTFEEPGTDETMDCVTRATTGGSSLDDDLTSVFVRVELRYRSLMASLLRQPAITVGASARAALQGAPYCGSTADTYECGDNSAALRCAISISSCADVTRSATAIVHTWPIVRFYRPNELTTACGPLCDPSTVTPLRFSTGTNLTSGVELLDLSRYSSREAPDPVPQLITNWDETGSAQAGTSPKADRTGACGRDWDTAGGEDPFTENGTCSLGNWFDHLVGAALGLNTEWRNDTLRAQLGTPNPGRPPALITSRQACSAAAATQWLPAPSCRDADVGDWIETVQRSMGSDLVSRMRAFIAREGAATRFSNDVVPNGPNAGNQYGKAAVVWIYMWDCGQEFDGDDDGQWNAVDDDCLRRASRRRPVDLRPPDEQADRVHLFSVIPVTFYEGLVTTDAIEGYVGGGFVDPGRCQTDRDCLLNPLANSAFLVADDP
jgi:hypothetical protein